MQGAAGLVGGLVPGNARIVDLDGSITVGDVSARLAAALDVPLRGEDDVSALDRLAHALAHDARPCVLRGVESLPKPTRDEIRAWMQRWPKRSPFARRGDDLTDKWKKGTLQTASDEVWWRDPILDATVRTLRRMPELFAEEDQDEAARADASGTKLISSRAQVDDALTELLLALPAIRRRGPLSIELDLLDAWLQASEANEANHATRATNVASANQPPRKMAANAVESADPWLRAQALVARGDVLRQLGRLEEARIDLEEARALARGEATLEATVIASLGRLHHHASRHEEAQTHYERALALARESHDTALIVETLLDLARLLRDTGRARDALPQAERALELQGREGSLSRRARAAGLVATLLHADNRQDDARAAYAVAIEAAERAGERAHAATSLANLGLLEREAGERRLACASLDRAADRFARLGIAASQGRTRLASALLALEDESQSTAVENAEEALELFAPDAIAADALFAHTSAVTLIFARAQAGDRMGARALAKSLAAADAESDSSGTAHPLRSVLSTMADARVLMADAAARELAGRFLDGEELRRQARVLYDRTKSAADKRTDLTAEYADVRSAARSLTSVLERVLAAPPRIPEPRPSKTRRFY